MKYFIAGHKGMVGSAVFKQLNERSETEILTASRSDLDLLSQEEVSAYLMDTRPDKIIICAAKVGGIQANNDFPADFIYENLMIQSHLIHGAHKAGIRKLLFLGSSCIYPRMSKQPISEDQLLTGALEPSNEAYAIAKIAGIKMCESYNKQFDHDFRSVMPTNLYGPGDNFNLNSSHVVPALIRKIHEAKINGNNQVEIWGTGDPRREFLHVSDMASACLFISDLDKEIYNNIISQNLSHINIGTGVDVTIRELAQLLVDIIGFKGELHFDTTRLDGTPRKLLDVKKLNNLGWKHEINLEEGLKTTYEWFLEFNHRAVYDA